jgi:hypothetical protein
MHLDVFVDRLDGGIYKAVVQLMPAEVLRPKR